MCTLNKSGEPLRFCALESAQSASGALYAPACIIDSVIIKLHSCCNLRTSIKERIKQLPSPLPVLLLWIIWSNTYSSTDNLSSPIPVSDWLIFCYEDSILHQTNKWIYKCTHFFDENQKNAKKVYANMEQSSQERTK